ncbi:MAG: hypothetical protein ACI4QD_03115 [Kiritimatiellia bacterium]
MSDTVPTPEENLPNGAPLSAEAQASQPSDLLNFDFAPEWAKGDSGVKVVQSGGVRSRPTFQSDDSGDEHGQDRFKRNRRHDSFKRDRPRRDFRQEDRQDRPPRDRSESRSGRREGTFNFRRPWNDRPPLKPLNLEVRLLPEQKALGNIMRRIQSSGHAYSLRDLVHLFMDNPASCLLRLSPKDSQSRQSDLAERNRDGATESDGNESSQSKPLNAKETGTATDKTPLFQCKICGMPALSEEELTGHILKEHFDSFYTTETIQNEPPSGTFTSVAKCDLNDEWVGPPNHHSFRTRMRELLQQYPRLDDFTLRKHIQILHDSESIEAWRAAASTRTVYRRKQEQKPQASQAIEGAEAPQAEAPAAESPALEREAAELEFRRLDLPGLILKPKVLTCPVQVASRTPSYQLKSLVQRTLSAERQTPHSLFNALRGAFRHRQFHLFRANNPQGQWFIIARTPVALDATNAVQEVKDALAYVAAHPCCSRHELMQALVPVPDEARIKLVANQVAFLLSKGHILEYYNGLLAIPSETPPFKLTDQEKAERQAANPHMQVRSNRIASKGAQPPAQSSVATESTPEVPTAESVPEAPSSTSVPTESPAPQPASDASEIKEPGAPSQSSEPPIAETTTEVLDTNATHAIVPSTASSEAHVAPVDTPKTGSSEATESSTDVAEVPADSEVPPATETP